MHLPYLGSLSSTRQVHSTAMKQPASLGLAGLQHVTNYKEEFKSFYHMFLLCRLSMLEMVELPQLLWRNVDIRKMS